MTHSRYLPPLVCLVALFTGCSSPPPVKQAEKARSGGIDSAANLRHQ